MSQPDMNDIMAQAAQMQAKLQEAQQEIVNSQVTGAAGGELVQVTMQGSGEVVNVKIDPKVVDADDVETLEDLVLGAFQDATAKLQQLADEKMGPLAQGFGGLDQLGF